MTDELIVDCQLRSGLELFAHTWDPLVIVALRGEPLRRRVLKNAIGGVSDKVLTESLHRLLANGLVARRSFAEAPPRVEYALTPLGRTLLEGPLLALGHWLEGHAEELLAAQEASEAG
ncbi:winged helix-turn-helix transcriptional regulator [Actinomadura oligospora]|uniref:winged helix-turn-helix transcriptional regulator n=1 Tax=Actinomadura oligospora TaxID=111804 RepID=UPI0004B31C7E|nr:helix-turn-helix domain-containing protein [Actinomadura oligospora]